MVGSCGDDAAARLVARALLMSGREVVFIGGDQSIEQVARTVVSEDAAAVVLDGSVDDLGRLAARLEEAGVGHVTTSVVDLSDANAAGVTDPTVGMSDPTPHRTA